MGGNEGRKRKGNYNQIILYEEKICFLYIKIIIEVKQNRKTTKTNRVSHHATVLPAESLVYCRKMFNFQEPFLLKLIKNVHQKGVLNQYSSCKDNRKTSCSFHHCPLSPTQVMVFSVDYYTSVNSGSLCSIGMENISS